MTETLEQQLIRHEGLRLKPYRCPAGKLTIGVGRNLDDVGITEQEAIMLLRNDINRCQYDLFNQLPWVSELPLGVQDALVNMCFNLGTHGLMGFKRFLATLEAGHYQEAAAEMLRSNWAKQVGNRAVELSEIIKKGA